MLFHRCGHRPQRSNILGLFHLFRSEAQLSHWRIFTLQAVWRRDWRHIGSCVMVMLNLSAIRVLYVKLISNPLTWNRIIELTTLRSSLMMMIMFFFSLFAIIVTQDEWFEHRNNDGEPLRSGWRLDWWVSSTAAASWQTQKIAQWRWVRWGERERKSQSMKSNTRRSVWGGTARESKIDFRVYCEIWEHILGICSLARADECGERGNDEYETKNVV